MDKYNWVVLEQMEWRNKTYEKGDVIQDTDNTYMRAMVHQNKIKREE